MGNYPFIVMGRKRQIPRMTRHVGSDGRLRARLRIDGEEYYLGPWGSEEAAREEARLVGEWLSRSGGPRGTDNATVAKLCDAFERHADQHYRKGDRHTSQYFALRIICGVLVELYGSKRAADFGAAELKVVRAAFVERFHPRCTGRVWKWSRRYVNDQVGRLRRIFRWGLSNGFEDLATAVVKIERVPPLAMGKTPAPEVPPKTEVADSLVEATLPHCKPTVATMIRLQRCSGMRPGEIVRLQVADIDRTADASCWLYEPAEHKCRRFGLRRRIWLGPKAQELLTPLVAGASGPEKFLFPATSRGRPYLVSSYRHHVVNACDKAGVPRWHPNQLRHSRLTEVAIKHGILQAQATGSHTNLNTTAIYAHFQDELARQSAKESG